MSDQEIRSIDRWVVGGPVIVAVALVVGSILRDDNATLYFSALGTLVFLYFRILDRHTGRVIAGASRMNVTSPARRLMAADRIFTK
jgi:hypothetical protein